MSLEFFIGVMILIFIVASGLIANLGWQHATQEKKFLQDMLDERNAQLLERENEIATLNSWLSILTAQGGK